MGGFPVAVLNSGEKIPILGMGTSTFDFTVDLVAIFVQAMEIGYRFFDTAAAYRTEKPLGEAIAEAIRRGIIKDRSELFITSKLWCTDAHRDLVLPAIKRTLENLGVEYLDLYLVHWPVSMKPGEITFPFKKENLVPMDFKSTWEGMEECQKLGLTKSIGVSNFSPKKLSELMAHAKIPPAVCQVEMNVTFQQGKLREYCREKGIHITAFSPLGKAGGFLGTKAVVESPVLKQIAEAKGKTVYQVALRWLHEQGVSVMVKSFNKERMKQNLEIFDWELSKKDLQEISKIPQERVIRAEYFISPSGPFKSLEDLWDEEA